MNSLPWYSYQAYIPNWDILQVLGFVIVSCDVWCPGLRTYPMGLLPDT